MSAQKKPCQVVEGGQVCGRPIKYRGMCKLHAERQRRNGDPLRIVPVEERNFPVGEANAKWTGDNASYSAVHQRLARTLGRAAEYPCSECGSRAAQWSYDHADPNERQADEGAYSVSVDHYIPRCIPCHKKLDLALKPKKVLEVDLEAVRELRNSGLGVNPIAERLGVPRRRVIQALDELGLPRMIRRGRLAAERCDEPMRPWRGVVSLCSKALGHTGNHEARRRPTMCQVSPERAA